MISKRLKNPFSKAILLIFSFMFFSTGIFMILFVNQLSLFTSVGLPVEITKVTQQFLGSAYLLLGGMMYSIRDLKGKPLFITLIFINISGFINLYLLYKFHSLIILPTIYFVVQVLVQIISLVALLEEKK